MRPICNLPGIRQGIGVDGRSLFIMPSEVFQHLSDQEVAALIAMIRRFPAGAEARIIPLRPDRLPWSGDGQV
jgi:hypothetical protein